MSEIKSTEWFVDWFGSPYYHLLYRNRNNEEADQFINQLIQFFKPPAGSSMLDIPCGSGRHAIRLAELGYNVTGADIAEESIRQAKNFENDHLHFFCHDIRNKFHLNHFDWVLNLFTSFGYFNNEKDSHDAFSTLANALKENGILVIDFLNAVKVRKHLPSTFNDRTGDVLFFINKKEIANFVIKEIDVVDGNRNFHFEERVQLLTKRDFEILFSKFNIELLHCFGNYNLETFDENFSDRMILVGKKL